MWFVLLQGCTGASGPEPTVEAATPDLACDAGAPVEVIVSGSGIAPVPTHVLTDPTLALPTLALTRSGGLDGTDDGVAGSLALAPGNGLRWSSASTVVFDASPAIGLTPGAWDLSLTNPDGQAATLPAGFLWAGPPEISDLSPASACVDSAAAPVTLAGGTFLVVDSASPTLTIGGTALPTVATDCVPLPEGHDGEVCATLTATIDPSALPLGTSTFTLTNPEPAACSAAGTFTVTLPPSLTSIEPERTCAEGAVLTLTGENLPDDPVVTVGGVEATVTSEAPGVIEITLAEGTPTGDVTVEIVGSDGCSATGTVHLVDSPDVYFVDPPTVYDGVSLVATVWIADTTSAVTSAWIEADDGTQTAVAFTWDEDEPGVLYATLPAGLPAGSYAFGFAEADGCGATLDDALTVADTLTVAVGEVDPAYAWEWNDTPVAITALDPIPDGYVGFQPIPRVYVSTGGAATALKGVDWRDEGLLTATVPAGLVPGAYDVIVANPDGSVGLLPGGLTVTEERPPEIDEVSPPSTVANRDEPIVVRGSSFRDPTLAFACTSGGVDVAAVAVVDAWTPTEIDATIPGGVLSDAVCVVEVTNADGTIARWAALSVRNPSENLFPWAAGTDMVEARRATAAAAARTSSVDRWVYAIGGDSGDATTPLDTVERAPMGVYGTLGTWATVDSRLPVATTLSAAAVVGDFVYLVGGDDGSGAVASTWRARVLDPEDAPELDSLSISDGGTLGGGDWVWRVAALYDAADDANPGGESVASDPIAVTLPEGGELAVTLTWGMVEGAVGYRVYRTPTADATADEEWVGDTVDPTFVDDGLPTDPTRLPLAEGALGEWAAMPDLLTARSGLCVALAPDPIPDPEVVHLYAAGGLDDDGDPLDSVEVLDITVVSDDEQVAGSWTDAGVTLADARWGCGAWTVDASRHSVVDDDEVWIYVGPGEGEHREVGTVDAGRVGDGGEIDGWTEIDDMSPARAGYGVASASDYLYAFGGQHGDPSAGGVSGELGRADMPDVWNWNSLGTSLTVARVWAGSAQESAVIVMLGGQTDTEAASRSTDVTNW